MPEVIVTGVLVNEPNVKLLQWIRFTIICYLTYYTYVAIDYSLDASASAWDVVIIMLLMYLCAFRLPTYGITAASASNERALSVFSCAQMTLAVWNVLQLVLMWSVLNEIIKACRECHDEAPCVLENAYQNITLSKEDCDTPLPTTKQTATTVLLSLAAFASVGASIHARKTKNAKVVTVMGAIDVPDVPTATGTADVQVEVV